MNARRTSLDPFRALIGVLERHNDSNALRAAAHSAGLVFNSSLSGGENFSHGTRIRALVPRILEAYDNLDEQDQLSVVRAVLVSTHDDEIVTAIERLGWSIQDGDLIVKTPEVREVFFPKGSPWDAYVILQDLFSSATAELTIVDSYADTTIFKMLSNRPLTGLFVRILCSKYVATLSSEAKPFCDQFNGVRVEIRQSRDFHDRFIIIDKNTCVHIGASIKDAGKTAFMISRVESDLTRSVLLKVIETVWAEATVV